MPGLRSRSRPWTRVCVSLSYGRPSGAVSRRMLNLPYVLWVLSSNCLILAALLLADAWAPPLPCDRRPHSIAFLVPIGQKAQACRPCGIWWAPHALSDSAFSCRVLWHMQYAMEPIRAMLFGAFFLQALAAPRGRRRRRRRRRAESGAGMAKCAGAREGGGMFGAFKPHQNRPCILAL